MYYSPLHNLFCFSESVEIGGLVSILYKIQGVLYFLLRIFLLNNLKT